MPYISSTIGIGNQILGENGYLSAHEDLSWLFRSKYEVAFEQRLNLLGLSFFSFLAT